MRVGPSESLFRQRFQTTFLLYQLRVEAGSEEVKRHEKCQVRIRKTNVNEPLKKRRKLTDDVKTGGRPNRRDKWMGHLVTAFMASGVKKA